MSALIDITGNRYGRWTVLRRAPAPNGLRGTFYECICDCGTISTVNSINLRKGLSRSCGCLKNELIGDRRRGLRYEINDIVGRRFGKLVALERVENRDGRIMYKCQCDCGGVKITKKESLISGETKSCGCLHSGKESEIAALLTERGIEYIREYHFPNLRSLSGGYLRFDFYLPEYHACIEFNGKQHYTQYGFKSLGGKTLEEEQENDEYKKQLALKNNIDNYIILDCRKSKLEWIKENILNSELSDILNLDDIDWSKCEQKALENPIIISKDERKVI